MPKIPTIGIITAPNIMEEHPSIAEALPAFLPWDERAREKLADRKPESKPVKEPEKADPYKAIVEKYERRAK